MQYYTTYIKAHHVTMNSRPIYQLTFFKHVDMALELEDSL